jgi:hypothetical protein
MKEVSLYEVVSDWLESNGLDEIDVDFLGDDFKRYTESKMDWFESVDDAMERSLL